MADRTPRFGFTTFDNPSDNLALNGYKAFGADRSQIDQLLTVAVERHRHNAQVITGTPPGPPDLFLATNGGMLPPNSPIYYRTSLVDARGQEHVASKAAVVYTPSQLQAPSPPLLVGLDNGTLPPGNYLYTVSAWTSTNDRETVCSNVITAILTDIGGVAIRMPTLPSSADGWNVYRKGPTDYEPMWVTSLPPTTDVWTDTGAVQASRTRGMPARNTSNSSSSVTITRPEELATGETLKIYRTFDPGNWDDSLLVWTGQPAYLDTGHRTRTGSPPDVALGAGGAPKVDLAAHTTGSPPPGLTHTSTEIVFSFQGPVQAGFGSWQYVNEYAQLHLLALHANLGRGSEPAASDVIVALEYRPAAGSIWLRFQSTIGLVDIAAVIPVGANHATPASFDPTDLPTPVLAPGDAIRPVIVQTGGGATPTDENLVVTVTAAVEHGSTTATYTWET